VGPREGPPRRAPAPGERALSRIRPTTRARLGDTHDDATRCSNTCMPIK
jgi:hypothetical protein